jgi:hypothetical protein
MPERLLAIGLVSEGNRSCIMCANSKYAVTGRFVDDSPYFGASARPRMSEQIQSNSELARLVEHLLISDVSLAYPTRGSSHL